MSSSSFNTVIKDTNVLVDYVQKFLPTLRSIANTGTSVTLAFSTVLTGTETTQLTNLMSTYVEPPTGLQTSTTNISQYNNSSVPLTATASYTGTWEDMSRYTSITVSVISDQTSATNGLIVQFGLTAAQVDYTRRFTVSAGTISSFPISTAGRWVRVLYTNGAIAQTSFSLQVKWSAQQMLTLVNGTDVVNDAMSAQLTRSIFLGKTDNNAQVGATLDEASNIRVRAAGFTVAPGSTPIVLANYTYNVNTETNGTTTAGTGSVTSVSGRAIVDTGASAASSASLSTRRLCETNTGRTVQVFAACAFSSAGVVGSSQYIGLGGTVNGLFVGYQDTVFGVLVRSNSVDTFTAATAFNIDKLNGTGPSAFTLDPLKGNTHVIAFDGNAYGCITFGIMGSKGDMINTHRVFLGNTSTSLGVRNYSGPLSAIVTNTTNATSVSIAVASLSAYASTVPNLLQLMRGTDATRYIQSTVFVPVLSLINKVTFGAIPNTTSLKLANVSLSTDGTRGGIVIGLYMNSTLTGVNASDVSTSTSVAQVDTSSTDLTNGTYIQSFTLYAASDRTIELKNVNVPPGATFTLAAKCNTGGVSITVSACLNWNE